ncbi:MAG TPA: ATP-binding protein, partial [Chthoniobacterales bacterium]|nr:ATP-binding protein [Chthoniobacterales bacterium]
AWLGSLSLAFSTKSQALAEFSIRQANATGVLYLAALNLLRLAISRPNESWGDLLRRSLFWLLTTAAIVVLCQTRFFLRGAEMPTSAQAVPVPIYGPIAINIYSGYFVLAFVSLIVSYWRAVRTTSGSARGELAFILIGGVAAMAIALLLTFVADMFVPQSQWMWIAPFRIIVFSLIVAYGIATKRILDVGFFLRRIMSYVLLGGYLLGLYTLVYWLLATVFHSNTDGSAIAHVGAGIAIAFAMAPARGVSQRLAERLFISSHRVDFRTTMSKAANILGSVTTLDDLLERFGTTIAEAVKPERIAILLHSRDRFEQVYALQASDTAYPTVSLSYNDLLVQYLRQHRAPIVLDELQRLRETAELEQLKIRMRTLKVAVVMGIFAREHLSGVMFLGQRTSGRVYGTTEQNALDVLCGQLAVAIDNAELFTEAQNAKIYNETLLENLTAGVIAVGADERITVFNNEVGRLTGIDSKKVLDRSVDFLPDALRCALRETLQTGQGVINREINLNSPEGAVTVRVSTSIFHGREGKVLGALAVLTDITALKRLEFQIRRSDRLASLGTLSAGMAHEIKNPLVSIKTFAQLLPERYQDSDFRQTFSNLIGHEIDRIDSLVNQLLRFARPAKPQLEPRHVHQILEKSLLLVGHRLYQKDIKLTRSWDANVDTIRADADQLEQVFLNFFLNAMDAMKHGGELHVGTEIRADGEFVSPLTQSNGQSHEVLRISIRDSGEGIKPEDLPHVFDPFFTTKDYGTGLGLSVVHGIIQEHGGQIEVESELNKGTAFHILFPLVRFDREVAAA